MLNDITKTTSLEDLLKQKQKELSQYEVAKGIYTSRMSDSIATLKKNYDILVLSLNKVDSAELRDKLFAKIPELPSNEDLQNETIMTVFRQRLESFKEEVYNIGMGVLSGDKFFA